MSKTLGCLLLTKYLSWHQSPIPQMFDDCKSSIVLFPLHRDFPHWIVLVVHLSDCVCILAQFDTMWVNKSPYNKLNCSKGMQLSESRYSGMQNLYKSSFWATQQKSIWWMIFEVSPNWTKSWLWYYFHASYFYLDINSPCFG